MGVSPHIMNALEKGVKAADRDTTVPGDHDHDQTTDPWGPRTRETTTPVPVDHDPRGTTDPQGTMDPGDHRPRGPRPWGTMPLVPEATTPVRGDHDLGDSGAAWGHVPP